MRVADKLDLDIVILNTGEARQLGGRDWLWRKTGVSGLAQAFQSKTLGDFLNVLGAGRDGFDLLVEKSNRSRGSIKVKPRVRPPGILESGKKTTDGGAKNIEKIAQSLRLKRLIKNPEHLDLLPAGAQLRIVTGGNDYMVNRRVIQGKMTYFARLRDHLHVALNGVRKFREAVWQVERPIKRGFRRDWSMKLLRRTNLSNMPRNVVACSRPNHLNPSGYRAR